MGLLVNHILSDVLSDRVDWGAVYDRGMKIVQAIKAHAGSRGKVAADATLDAVESLVWGALRELLVGGDPAGRARGLKPGGGTRGPA